MDADGDCDGLSLALGDWEALGLVLGDSLADGDWLAEGLTLGDSDEEGETLALGLVLGDSLLEGEILALGETDGLSLALGLVLALGDGDSDDEGLRLALGLILGLSLEDGEAEAEGERLALGETEGLPNIFAKARWVITPCSLSSVPPSLTRRIPELIAQVTATLFAGQSAGLQKFPAASARIAEAVSIGAKVIRVVALSRTSRYVRLAPTWSPIASEIS